MSKLNKSLRITLVLVGVIVLMTATITGAVWVTNTQTAKKANEQRKCDVASYESFKVVIQDDKMKPAKVTATQCDKLTITNRDAKDRRIAFGRHNQHVAYDGITEKVLEPDQSFTITLDKTGTYTFHDHFQDEVKGSFTVEERRAH